MKTIEKPLKRSILIFTIAFIALLCVTLSILAYSTFSSSLYRAYDKRTSDIIEYVESHIDIEDLTKCIETGVETEKFKEMGLLMDSIMEDFDIHYLYIVKPVLGDAEHGMMNIFSADTAEGRATDPDGYYLNYVMYDVYTEEDLQTYQAALERNTISRFKNFTTWGYDYTAAQPLINDAGEHIALLCVDINVEDVQFAITAHTAITVVLIMVMGMVFITVFTMWMSSNVTEPIGQLEKSVGAFAKLSHSKEEKDPKEEMENIQQAIDDLCEFATEEVEKSCGKLPGEMEGRIKLIREKKKPKPITDWKKHFRRYIGNEFSDQIKKSRKRESKRFPDAAGNRHKRKSHILVAVDTSGSVSMPEYNEFFGQIRTIKDTTFHVVECDSRIQHEYDFRGKIPQELHGGGGTDFSPVMDLYWANRRKYEGVVYFTDGECPIPDNTPKETLWVVSSKGDHNRKKYLKNGASVVFIPKKEEE